jgi:mannose-6-phosphate isomerase
MKTRARDALPRGATAFERRPWGGFQTLEEGEGYKVKRLVVEPGHRLSLQRHRHRAEHWVVVEGSAHVCVGSARKRLRSRQSVTVPRGAWHRIENPGPDTAVIIEVQYGGYLGEDDIIRRDDDYGRAAAGAPAGGATPAGRPAPAASPRGVRRGDSRPRPQRRTGGRAARYSVIRRASGPSGATAR